MATGRLFKNKYRIDTTRLKNWNYAWDGYYFVTICVKNRICCLGDIVGNGNGVGNGNVVGNTKYGIIVQKQWNELPTHYSNCVLDAFVIMPNHVHAVVVLKNDGVDKLYSLFEMIRGFKTFSAKQINKIQNFAGRPFWQSRFYDHIIRDEKSYHKIVSYIANNPDKWERDRNNKPDLWM